MFGYKYVIFNTSDKICPKIQLLFFFPAAIAPERKRERKREGEREREREREKEKE